MVLNSFSTATEVIRGQDLTGKVAVVTGGNSGIGVETVRALAQAGAKVYLTSRSIEKGEKVANEIRSKGIKGAVEVVQLDLTDIASIHRLSNYIQSQDNFLHYLILNAGLMLPQKQKTKYGFDAIMAANHYGNVQLVEELLDFMIKMDQPARIVIVSSDGYMMGNIDFDNLDYDKSWFYNGGKVYGDSKLANVLHCKALAKRLADTKIRVFSNHPGGIFTGLPGKIVPLGMYEIFRRNSQGFTYLMSIASRGEMKNTEQGAATQVYAATAPELDPYTGYYLRNCGTTDVWWFAKDQKKADKLYEISKQRIKEAKL